MSTKTVFTYLKPTMKVIGHTMEVICIFVQKFRWKAGSNMNNISNAHTRVHGSRLNSSWFIWKKTFQKNSWTTIITKRQQHTVGKWSLGSCLFMSAVSVSLRSTEFENRCLRNLFHQYHCFLSTGSHPVFLPTQICSYFLTLAASSVLYILPLCLQSVAKKTKTARITLITRDYHAMFYKM